MVPDSEDHRPIDGGASAHQLTGSRQCTALKADGTGHGRVRELQQAECGEKRNQTDNHDLWKVVRIGQINGGYCLRLLAWTARDPEAHARIRNSAWQFAAAVCNAAEG